MIVNHGYYKVRKPFVTFRITPSASHGAAPGRWAAHFGDLEIDHEATVWEPIFLIFPMRDETGKRRWFETAWRRYTNSDPLFGCWRHEEIVFGDKPANSVPPNYLAKTHALAA